MASFIEELYYGNIDPQARGYRQKSPVKRVSDSLNGLEEKLTEQLVGENKDFFSASATPTLSSWANASWIPSSLASASVPTL